MVPWTNLDKTNKVRSQQTTSKGSPGEILNTRRQSNIAIEHDPQKYSSYLTRIYPTSKCWIFPYIYVNFYQRATDATTLSPHVLIMFPSFSPHFWWRMTHPWGIPHPSRSPPPWWALPPRRRRRGRRCHGPTNRPNGKDLGFHRISLGFPMDFT